MPGTASGQPQGSGAPITDLGTVDNKKLREAVGGLMQALSMTISQEFSTYLDQLEMSQEAGHKILSQMVDKLSKGENPSPPGYQVRPPTTAEISAAATRAAANKKAAEEADAIAKRLAKEKEEAEARKAAEEEIATAARFKVFQEEETRIFNVQQTCAAAQADAQVAPLVQAILAGIGRKPPAKMPVRTHPLPALPPGRTGPGQSLPHEEEFTLDTQGIT